MEAKTKDLWVFVETNEDGTATLRLTLNDLTTPLLHLELLAPTPEQGERWAGAFRAGPEELYLLITKRLEEGGDFHETK